MTGPRVGDWRRRTTRSLLLLATVASFGCNGPPDDPVNDKTPPSYYVALGARQEPRLLILRSDGTELTRIPCQGFDSRAVSPTWSRDGQKLSVGCIRDTLAVLFSVNRDGTALREVAAMPRYLVGEGKGQRYVYPEFMEDWSADGKLVYIRSTVSEASIETLAADGTTRTTIYRESIVFPETYLLASPRWNATGGTIVVWRSWQLRGIGSDGGDLRPLTVDLDLAGDRVTLGSHFWSPDGRTVGFIAASGNGTTSLRTVDAPTGQGRRLLVSDGAKRFESFCWSPDGSRISLVATDTSHDLLTLSSDGTNARIEASGLALLPSEPKAAWTPDGGKLIFVRANRASGNVVLELTTHSLQDGAQAKIVDLPAVLTFAISSGPQCQA